MEYLRELMTQYNDHIIAEFDILYGTDSIFYSAVRKNKNTAQINKILCFNDYSYFLKFSEEELRIHGKRQNLFNIYNMLPNTGMVLEETNEKYKECDTLELWIREYNLYNKIHNTQEKHLVYKESLNSKLKLCTATIEK